MNAIEAWNDALILAAEIVNNHCGSGNPELLDCRDEILGKIIKPENSIQFIDYTTKLCE